jgi:hypothetical protein
VFTAVAALGATAPVLSLAVDTANGPTAGAGGCTTDLGNGTLYVVALLTADSVPSAPQIGAGLKADGVTAAPWAWSQAVSGTGAQTITYSAVTNAQMLTESTGYKFAFSQQSAGGAWSNVVVGDGFTTAALLRGQMALGQTSITNPVPVTGSIAVVAGDAATLVFAEQGAAPTATAVTDNLGNTYTAVNAGGTNTVSGRAFTGIITVPGTITAVNVAATASSNDGSADFCAFAGPFTALDAAPAIRSDSTTAFTGNATGTLTQPSELVVGLLMTASNADPLTATAPWLLAGTPASTGIRRAATVYQNVAATASATPSFTGTNSTALIQTVSFARAA